MLRLLPHHRQNRTSRSITEIFELELAEQKLLFLTQSESFHVKLNKFHKKLDNEYLLFRRSSVPEVCSVPLAVFALSLLLNLTLSFASFRWPTSTGDDAFNI